LNDEILEDDAIEEEIEQSDVLSKPATTNRCMTAAASHLVSLQQLLPQQVPQILHQYQTMTPKIVVAK